MKKKALIMIGLLLAVIACKKDNVETSYLDQWTGSYKGTSHHWSYYPDYHGEDYKKVNVIVEKGVGDSILNLVITYDDSTTYREDSLKFSTKGTYNDSWGLGSSYGSIQIRFSADTLHYGFFQQCGISCSSGIDFKAGKVSL